MLRVIRNLSSSNVASYLLEVCEDHLLIFVSAQAPARKILDKMDFYVIAKNQNGSTFLMEAFNLVFPSC
jgi:hypothetical protein